MKKLNCILLLILISNAHASSLKLSQPILYIEHGNAYAVLNVRWENAWKNERNHDAIWLFFKSISNNLHVSQIKVASDGHRIVHKHVDNHPELAFKLTPDSIGLFLSVAKPYRGTVHATLSIRLSTASFKNIATRNALLTAYGIEMVNIPYGEFYLGEPDNASLKYGTIYRPLGQGSFGGPVKVAKENQVFQISKKGDLYYEAPEGYEGDQSGEISNTFPKGVDPFYMMKYELTEGQYVAFLNSLSPDQQLVRDISSDANYIGDGGSITKAGEAYKTPFPDKPCRFVGWDDAMAYADWAGLRPMTEFEFTKACRGGGKPIANQFPWGTSQKIQIQRLPDQNGVLSMLNEMEEAAMSDQHKPLFGASHYWVMDLAGSLWERVITIGHESGRKFKGNHGDGVLNEAGNANTLGWPIGDENAGGVGFRGGGFYGYDREYHEYNPFSPVAYRPYGGWHGTMRSKAYGTRFVRTE